MNVYVSRIKENAQYADELIERLMAERVVLRDEVLAGGCHETCAAVIRDLREEIRVRNAIGHVGINENVRGELAAERRTSEMMLARAVKAERRERDLLARLSEAGAELETLAERLSHLVGVRA